MAGSTLATKPAPSTIGTVRPDEISTPASVIPLMGRILLSAIFIMAGAMKIPHWDATAASMANEGMIAVPFSLAAAILFEVGGGLSLLLGWQARFGALLLVVFLIPATLIFHDFWTYDGLAQQEQMQHFTKNVAIMGGLLGVVYWGAGPFGLDASRARLADETAR